MVFRLTLIIMSLENKFDPNKDASEWMNEWIIVGMHFYWFAEVTSSSDPSCNIWETPDPRTDGQTDGQSLL